jgi:hypothetical protein
MTNLRAPPGPRARDCDAAAFYIKVKTAYTAPRRKKGKMEAP